MKVKITDRYGEHVFDAKTTFHAYALITEAWSGLYADEDAPENRKNFKFEVSINGIPVDIDKYTKNYNEVNVVPDLLKIARAAQLSTWFRA